MTTVELLVAMQIALLIIAFVFAGYQLSLRWHTCWKHKRDLNDAAVFLSKTLTKDIQKCSKILCAGTRELEFILLDGGIVHYEIQKNQLKRNGQILFPTNVIIQDLQFRYLRKTNQKISQLKRNDDLENFIPLTESDFAKIALINWKVHIHSRGRSIHLDSMMGIRFRNLESMFDGIN